MSIELDYTVGKTIRAALARYGSKTILQDGVYRALMILDDQIKEHEARVARKKFIENNKGGTEMKYEILMRQTFHPPYRIWYVVVDAGDSEPTGTYHIAPSYNGAERWIQEHTS